jgi:hypothetical protein
VVVAGQPLSFVIGQGFTISLGDTITIDGYAENGEFKVGRVTNLTNRQSIQLRDVDGRPAWRGQGRGN